MKMICSTKRKTGMLRVWNLIALSWLLYANVEKDREGNGERLLDCVILITSEE